MDTVLEITKVVCLFLAIWMGTPITVKAMRGIAIHWLHIIVFAIGLTGFIYLQWLI